MLEISVSKVRGQAPADLADYLVLTGAMFAAAYTAANIPPVLGGQRTTHQTRYAKIARDRG